MPASMQDAPMWSTSMVMQAMVLRAVPLKVRRGESAVIKNTSFRSLKIVTGTITEERRRFLRLMRQNLHRTCKIGAKCLTEKARDSTIKKIIELSQMKDEKDSQRIGRLRTRKDGRRLWA